MAGVEVRPVHSRREQKQFLRLPWTIYAGDPHWVPPLVQHVREMAGFAHHPFYLRNRGQAFLAFRRGEPVGRVLAIVNHDHNERFGERRGFFGFFESVDDPHVAAALFDSARAWLADQGMNCLRGPVNPSLNYEIALLVEGFDSPPYFLMTYNPPYYARLLDRCGLEKSQDVYAFHGQTRRIGSLDRKMWQIPEQVAERFNVTVRPLDTSRFLQEVESFLAIYNKSLVATWGFVPMSAGEVRAVARTLRLLIVPELVNVAEIDGQPVGSAFGLLDYNQRLKRMNGRLWPLGFLRLMLNRRAIKRMRVVSANVLPEYQMWGLGLLLMNRMVPAMRRWGMEEVEFSWVLESNHFSRGTLERGGAELRKVYRIYDG